MTEPQRIYLGTVPLDEPGATLALDIPLDADADTIAAAIEAANLARAEAQARESKRLRAIFLDGERHE
jgi:hypothetical protein